MVCLNVTTDWELGAWLHIQIWAKKIEIWADFELKIILHKQDKYNGLKEYRTAQEKPMCACVYLYVCTCMYTNII
jgi:hypothetical protein